MQADTPKQYLSIAGRMIIEHSLRSFLFHPALSGLVVVISPDDVYWQTVASEAGLPVYTACGGPQRHQSTLNGLRVLASHAGDNDWVLVHDAVRPCIDTRDIDRLMAELGDDPVGGLLAVPVRDTLKQVSAQRVAATVERSALWHAQTPQMFRYKLLYDAMQAAADTGVTVTDESQALENAGYRPRIVPGNHSNIKITYPEDLAVAEMHLMRGKT